MICVCSANGGASVFHLRHIQAISHKPYAVGQVYEVSFSGPIYDVRDLKPSHLGLCGSKTIRDVHKLSFFRHLTGWMIFQLPFLDRKEAPFFKYTEIETGKEEPFHILAGMRYSNSGWLSCKVFHKPLSGELLPHHYGFKALSHRP